MSVVLLSGGLDSAVLLASERTEGRPVTCISFDYGQRHGTQELDAARRVARFYGLRMNTFNLPPAIFANSALTGVGKIPDAHYEDPIQKVTIVPNRNMVFISLAASAALTWGIDEICFAGHKGDAAIYPDCRGEFVDAIGEVLRLGCGLRIRAPFLEMTKRDIIQLGHSLNAPIDLTWSCHEGGKTPCNLCGACRERAEALL